MIQGQVTGFFRIFQDFRESDLKLRAGLTAKVSLIWSVDIEVAIDYFVYLAVAIASWCVLL